VYLFVHCVLPGRVVSQTDWSDCWHVTGRLDRRHQNARATAITSQRLRHWRRNFHTKKSDGMIAVSDMCILFCCPHIYAFTVSFTNRQCRRRHVAFSGCPSAAFVRSSGQILLPRYLVNGLSSYDETYWEYSLASRPVDDLVRFWRLKVKVTAGRRGGKASTSTSTPVPGSPSSSYMM